jgi:hypothetical protein
MPGTLLAAWSFDETSGDVIDHSGGGRHFALTGSTIRTADGGGAHGRGLTQSGGEVFTALPSLAGLQPIQRTWMVNFKTTTAFIGWLVEFFRASSADTGVFGLLYLSGQLRFRAKDTSNTPFEINISASSSFRNGTATYDGTTLRFYLDGVLAGSAAMGSIWAGDSLRMLDGSGANAVIDDVRLFDGALTPEEIDAWRVLPADQMPAAGGRLKYESAPGVWTPVPVKTETGELLVVKSETSPGTWEALP